MSGGSDCKGPKGAALLSSRDLASLQGTQMGNETRCCPPTPILQSAQAIQSPERPDTYLQSIHLFSNLCVIDLSTYGSICLPKYHLYI